jgi:poly(A) polymerase
VLVRYGTSEKGKAEKRAEVYLPDEHGIQPSDIDSDAIKVLRKFRAAGCNAYIVGGAVRDLLLGRKPKDFDLVTDAYPNKIRKMFRNSRVIGRRFRLVHIFFHQKIFEVSTFRSLTSDDSDSPGNIYGTIEDDVLRRDFSFNALYYCPLDQTLIDYIGGLKDIREGKMVPLIDLNNIFVEDPVRMIRAVRYSEITGFPLSQKLKRKIKKGSALLGDCPPSRMTEEIFKILGSGHAENIIRTSYDLQILTFMLPGLNTALADDTDGFSEGFFKNLHVLDEKVGRTDEIGRGKLLVGLVKDFIKLKIVELRNDALHETLYQKEIVHSVKSFIRPMVPANKDLDYAISVVTGKKVHRPSKRGRHFPRHQPNRQFSSKAHPPLPNNSRD